MESEYQILPIHQERHVFIHLFAISFCFKTLRDSCCPRSSSAARYQAGTPVFGGEPRLWNKKAQRTIDSIGAVNVQDGPEEAGIIELLDAAIGEAEVAGV